jgi:hypothetical protein
MFIIGIDKYYEEKLKLKDKTIAKLNEKIEILKYHLTGNMNKNKIYIKQLKELREENKRLSSKYLKRARHQILDKVKKAVFKRDGYICLCCGATEDLTVDHIVPISKGGNNKASNLQTLCFNCNLRKGDSYFDYRFIERKSLLKNKNKKED